MIANERVPAGLSPLACTCKFGVLSIEPSRTVTPLSLVCQHLPNAVITLARDVSCGYERLGRTVTQASGAQRARTKQPVGTGSDAKHASCICSVDEFSLSAGGDVYIQVLLSVVQLCTRRDMTANSRCVRESHKETTLQARACSNHGLASVECVGRAVLYAILLSRRSPSSGPAAPVLTLKGLCALS